MYDALRERFVAEAGGIVADQPPWPISAILSMISPVPHHPLSNKRFMMQRLEWSLSAEELALIGFVTIAITALRSMCFRVVFFVRRWPHRPGGSDWTRDLTTVDGDRDREWRGYCRCVSVTIRLSTSPAGSSASTHQCGFFVRSQCWVRTSSGCIGFVGRSPFLTNRLRTVARVVIVVVVVAATTA